MLTGIRLFAQPSLAASSTASFCESTPLKDADMAANTCKKQTPQTTRLPLGHVGSRPASGHLSSLSQPTILGTSLSRGSVEATFHNTQRTAATDGAVPSMYRPNPYLSQHHPSDFSTSGIIEGHSMQIWERIGLRVSDKIGESWLVFAAATTGVFALACFEGWLLCRNPNIRCVRVVIRNLSSDVQFQI